MRDCLLQCWKTQTDDMQPALPPPFSFSFSLPPSLPFSLHPLRLDQQHANMQKERGEGHFSLALWQRDRPRARTFHYRATNIIFLLRTARGNFKKINKTWQTLCTEKHVVELCRQLEHHLSNVNARKMFNFSSVSTLLNKDVGATGVGVTFPSWTSLLL